MIYNFIYPLADIFSPLNIFRYLTFRSIAAFLTALIISFVIGGGLIRFLRSKQKQGQPIREDGPVSHVISKKGTPTMGGLLILISLVIATLVGRPANRYVWIVLGVTAAFGIVVLDDFKVTKRNTKGVPEGEVRVSSVVGVAPGSPPRARRRRCATCWPFRSSGRAAAGGMIGFIARRLRDRRHLNAVNLTDGLAGWRWRDHGGDGLRPARLPRGQRAYRATCSCTRARTGELAVLLSLGGGSASCGSTRRRRWSSWATPDRSRSAARSARPRS